MIPVDDATPTSTLVIKCLYNYALLLLDFHNAMLDAEEEDDPTRYAILLKFDGELRASSVEKVPKCFSHQVPQDPAWPKWVSWARRLYQGSVNHKIIMLHQTFLSKSFKDVRYTYSRWACATAAKKIISMYSIRELEEPQWWVEQAFIVTAGICLILDLFHRTENDPEAQEYQVCVQKAINYLQQFFVSSIAVRGVRLLLSLQQEYNKTLDGSKSNVNQVLGTAKACPLVPPALPHINAADGVRTSHNHHLPSDVEVPLSHDEAAQFNFDIDMLGFEDLMDYLPAEGGLDNTFFFDSTSGLANLSS